MAENDFNFIADPQQREGLESRDSTLNPDKYTAELNNPLARGLLSAFGGMKAATGLGNVSPYEGGDALALLAGAAGGLQAGQQYDAQALEMAPLKSVSPKLAEAFPEVSDMPAKSAYDLIGKLQTYFANKQKGSPLDQDDIPAVKASLLAKGFSQEEADKYAPSFVNQTWDVVKNVPRKNAFADFEGGEPELMTMANGMKAYKIRTRSGYRYQIVPGQVMTESDRSRLALVKQALTAADRLADYVQSPRGQELILKSGHSWKKLSSLADTEAQNLAKDIFLVADANARIRTGAAINRDEMDMYFNNLISAVNTKQANLENVFKEKSFFEDYLRNLTFGKNVPEGTVPSSGKTGGKDKEKPKGKGLSIESASLEDIMKAAGEGE